MEIKETVLDLLDDKQALIDLQNDMRFKLARSLAENLPAQSLAEAKSEYCLKSTTGDIDKIREVLKFAFIRVFQDGFLRGLQLARTPEFAQGIQPNLNIGAYYKALKAFPDLEETIAEVAKRKLQEVEPHLEEAFTLPAYMDIGERELVLDTLAKRQCNKLLDFGLLAGKVCLEKAEQSGLRLL